MHVVCTNKPDCTRTHFIRVKVNNNSINHICLMGLVIVIQIKIALTWSITCTLIMPCPLSNKSLSRACTCALSVVYVTICLRTCASTYLLTFAFSLARSIGHRLRNATVFCQWPPSPFLSWCTPSPLYLLPCLFDRCFVASLFSSSLGGSM